MKKSIFILVFLAASIFGFSQTPSQVPYFTPTQPLYGKVGVLFKFNLYVYGGTGNLTVYAVEGDPKGIDYDSVNQRFYGTPTQAGFFPVRMRVADIEGKISEIIYGILITQ